MTLAYSRHGYCYIGPFPPPLLLKKGLSRYELQGQHSLGVQCLTLYLLSRQKDCLLKKHHDHFAISLVQTLFAAYGQEDTDGKIVMWALVELINLCNCMSVCKHALQLMSQQVFMST